MLFRTKYTKKLTEKINHDYYINCIFAQPISGKKYFEILMKPRTRELSAIRKLY